jgi:hypothetical protein
VKFPSRVFEELAMFSDPVLSKNKGFFELLRYILQVFINHIFRHVAFKILYLWTLSSNLAAVFD